MSRIGKLPIVLPPGVKVAIKENTVTVTGPKGESSRVVHPDMKVEIQDGKMIVTRPSDSKEHRSLHGLTRSLLFNMVQGVTTGFMKNLEIVGVGYRVEQTGPKLLLRLGFSHPVEVTPLPGVVLGIEGTTKIKVSGVDKESVGQMAALIKGMRIPDRYKGKGIRYAGEVIHLKAGKAGKAVGQK